MDNLDLLKRLSENAMQDIKKNIMLIVLWISGKNYFKNLITVKI